jgi:hypothetical protein
MIKRPAVYVIASEARKSFFVVALVTLMIRKDCRTSLAMTDGFYYFNASRNAWRCT